MKLLLRVFLIFSVLSSPAISSMGLVYKLFERLLISGGVVAPGSRNLFQAHDLDDFSDGDDDLVEQFLPGYFSRAGSCQDLKDCFDAGQVAHEQAVVFVFYPQIIDSPAFRRRFVSDYFYLLKDVVLPAYNAIMWLDAQTSKIWIVFRNTEDGDLRETIKSFSKKLEEWSIGRFKKTKLYAVCAAGAVTYYYSQSGEEIDLEGDLVDEVYVCSSASAIPENETKRILCAPSIFAYFNLPGYNPAAIAEDSIAYKVYSFKAFSDLFDSEGRA